MKIGRDPDQNDIWVYYVARRTSFKSAFFQGDEVWSGRTKDLRIAWFAGLAEALFLDFGSKKSNAAQCLFCQSLIKSDGDTSRVRKAMDDDETVASIERFFEKDKSDPKKRGLASSSSNSSPTPPHC